nr:GerAB/ArcD/ProY family transporter [Cohnella cholangitidis]
MLRLNLLFLPAVLLMVLVVFGMNIGAFNFHNLKPMFITDWKDILFATQGTVFSFLGFEIVLFYNIWINKPNRTVRAVMSGLLLPLVLYIVVFISVIGIFGSSVTQNTLYPTAELAKQVEIPGGFFERFESIFFTIWVMTLFNTAAMAFDVTIVAARSVFPKTQRITWIVFLCPVIYLLSMQPRNVKELEIFGQWISYAGIVIGWGFPILLLLLAKLRGVKGDGQNV